LKKSAGSDNIMGENEVKKCTNYDNNNEKS
jgi:hypothetical protein